MDRGAWWATVYGVTKNQIQQQLNNSGKGWGADRTSWGVYLASWLEEVKRQI